MSNTQNTILGIFICFVVGFLATLFNKFIPLGTVTIAILLGILGGNTLGLGDRFKRGVTFCEKHFLSLAIVLMGTKLDYPILKELGYGTILLIMGAMTFTILTSLLLGRALKLKTSLALLLGIGNGVCGSSAIAATEQIVGANEEEVGISVAIVNFMGTIGIFILPLLGKSLLKLTDIHTGLLIGNTLQAVGQVTAASFSVGEVTGQIATIVKMGRILMLTPLILILLITIPQKSSAPSKRGKTKRIPPFIIGFILFSLIPTFKLLPPAPIEILGMVSHYALLVAMAGVGLKIKFSSILQKGKPALLSGSLIFLFQILFSGLVIFIMF